MVAWNHSNASTSVLDPTNEIEDALDNGATGPAAQDERIAIESEALPG
jgi:hypothetical protein